MHQSLNDQATDRIKSRGTQALIIGDVSPDELVTRPQRNTTRSAGGQFGLILAGAIGIILLCVYLLFVLLLARHEGSPDPIQHFWVDMYPALGTFHARDLIPALAQVDWLKMSSADIYANLLLALLVLATLLASLAAFLSTRAVRAPLTRRRRERTLFGFVMVLTMLFAVMMLAAPAHLNAMSQTMLLSGFYGRVVTTYHANPYLITATSFQTDSLHHLLLPISQGSITPQATTFGPVWIDISILVALATRDSTVGVILGFRLLALLAHVISVLLIWKLLAEARPMTRVSAIVLYAWNPLVLLLGISQMHLEIFLVLFVLLAIYFYKRRSLFLSWVFLVLAALLNLSCLLLLPLFLRLLVKQTRFMRLGWRFLWWIGLLLLSALVVGLACIPYWQDWSMSSVSLRLFTAYLPHTAFNSFDAALLKLPDQLPADILWLFMPAHWTVIVLALLLIFILFALWIADTLELALLFGGIGLLLLAVLFPVYWPWAIILPFALVISSGNRTAILLGIFLMLGALFSYYFWLYPQSWTGQGLLTIGLPGLFWGWLFFFVSTWQRIYASKAEIALKQESRPLQLARPPWFSRPSRTGRSRH